MDTYLTELSASAAAGSLCAICCVERATTPFHMTHGVVIRLCRVHTAADYLRRKRGTVFARRLAGIWKSHGMLTTRRQAALAAHTGRIRSALIGRGRPGSYSWPALRQLAEQRFAAGEDPAAVISDLRTRYSGGHARCPAIRTMRRWFTEARWLAPPPAPTPSPSALTLRWEEAFGRRPLEVAPPYRSWMVFLREPPDESRRR